MWIILLAAALFAADQALKYLSRQNKLPDELLPGGQVRLTHLENDGLLGGKHRGEKTYTLVVPCLSFLAALSGLLPGLKKRSNAEKAGVALIVAGGISNIFDRLVRGSVTDYIRFPRLPWKKLRTLVWNLADFLLIIGGVIVTVCNFFRWLRRKKD